MVTIIYITYDKNLMSIYYFIKQKKKQTKYKFDQVLSKKTTRLSYTLSII